MIPDGDVRTKARSDAVIGISIWVVIFALSTGPLSDRIGLLEGLWLLGPLVVVPLATGLLHAPPGADDVLLLMRRLTLPAALLVVLSILADPGVVSALLVLPWVAVGGIGLWVAVRWVAVVPATRAKVLVPVCGLAFLAIGAATLVAWRAQLQPLGVSDTSVALATVHFTFAGFGTAVVADRTRAAATRKRSRSVGGAAGIATVASMLVLGVGFLTHGPLIDAIGTVALSLSLIVVATVMLIGAMHRDRRPGSTALLVVSGGSLVFALVLAVQFAIGQWNDDYTLTVTRMLELHGTVGGLGFVVGGLLGWTLADLPEELD
jgi:YndJ-like protein